MGTHDGVVVGALTTVGHRPAGSLGSGRRRPAFSDTVQQTGRELTARFAVVAQGRPTLIKTGSTSRWTATLVVVDGHDRAKQLAVITDGCLTHTISTTVTAPLNNNGDIRPLAAATARVALQRSVRFSAPSKPVQPTAATLMTERGCARTCAAVGLPLLAGRRARLTSDSLRATFRSAFSTIRVPTFFIRRLTVDDMG